MRFLAITYILEQGDKRSIDYSLEVKNSEGICSLLIDQSMKVLIGRSMKEHIKQIINRDKKFVENDAIK